MKTQGERIREIRTSLNLSQEELGKIFNTSKQYISKIENNMTKQDKLKIGY